MLACEERGSVGTLAGVAWLNPALTHTAFVWDQLNALYACIYLLTWIPKRQKMSRNTARTDVNIVLRLWPFSLKRIGPEPLVDQCHLPLQESFPPPLFLLFSLLYMTWPCRDI